ncbi:hypothetical protein K0B04_02790 [Patescibacteria group bacterium]|nr:hypothetical protein [Patescibacteria group bacterium]
MQEKKIGTITHFLKKILLKGKSESSKFFILILILTIQTIIIIIFLYYFKHLKIKNSNLEQATINSIVNEKPKTTSQPNSPNQKATRRILANPNFLPSPKKNYSIKISHFDDREDKCTMYVVGGNEFEKEYFSLNELLGVESFDCYVGMFGLDTKIFLGWHDDNNLSLETPEGYLHVIEILEKGNEKYGQIIYSFSYDSELRALETNVRKDVFLFRDESGEDIDKIIILNLKTNKILKEMDFEKKTIFSPLYDRTNDGYVITQRFHKDNKVETKILFLNMEYLSLKTLLHNSPLEVVGRGCGPVEILSNKKGELIYNAGGCLTLDDSKYSSDGNIHIDL